jgi:Na+-driven multidrug efflux pump
MSFVIYLGMYCFYLFRKTLRYFQQVKPFDKDVIANFYKIGWLLSIVGSIGSIGFFLGHILLQHQIKLNLGFSPYLTIICLGLFFMVLSELFKVAKKAKEENELTI